MGIINTILEKASVKREESYNHAPKAVAYQMRSDREQRDRERREYQKIKENEKRYFEEKKKRDIERAIKAKKRAEKVKRGIAKVENSKASKFVDTVAQQGIKDVSAMRKGKSSISHGGRIPARAETPKLFMDVGGIGIFDGIAEDRPQNTGGFNSLEYLGMDAFNRETPKKRKSKNEYEDYMRSIIF